MGRGIGEERNGGGSKKLTRRKRMEWVDIEGEE